MAWEVYGNDDGTLPRRTRTIHDRSAKRPRELADPKSTSTTTGASWPRRLWRCVRDRMTAAVTTGPALAPAGSGRLLQGWRRRVVLLIVASFLLLNAYGLCSTYGYVGFD